MIIREDNCGRFSRVPCTLINDPRLKTVDVGIMTYLLACAPAWKVRQKVVAKKCRVSLATVKASFKRLVAAGYAEYRQEREPGGEWGAGDWVIYAISRKPMDGENQQDAEAEEESEIEAGSGWAAL